LPRKASLFLKKAFKQAHYRPKGRNFMAVYTDIAAELYPESRGSVPRGVKTFTATALGFRPARGVDLARGTRGPKKKLSPANKKDDASATLHK